MSTTLVDLESRLSKLEILVSGLMARAAGPAAGKLIVEPCPDQWLDEPKNDRVVKFDPKRWVKNGGQSFAGSPMSRCPAEYLRELADLFAWQYGKDKDGEDETKRKFASYRLKDARIALAWAIRVEEGRVAGAPQAPTPAPRKPAAQASLIATPDDDDIPF